MRAAEGDAFLQLGGLSLSVYPRVALAEGAGVVEGNGFRDFRLGHNTASREETDAVLAALVKPAQDALRGGYPGYSADSDGVLWAMAWNLVFEHRPDGSVHLPD